MSFQMIKNDEESGKLLEKVILGNDLSSLSPIEKVQYVKSICSTLGLNPVTKPIQLMKFQGKEIPYFTKDATEQLRKLNRVSINRLESKIEEGIYIVTAYARISEFKDINTGSSISPYREDSSTGVVVTANLKGDALANAMMKAETKAKRRVTLSICGLGFIDECEVESIPGAIKTEIIDNPVFEEDIEAHLLDIKSTQSLDELKSVFTQKSAKFKGQANLLKQIIEAKDMRKFELTLDTETGEVTFSDDMAA